MDFFQSLLKPAEQDRFVGKSLLSLSQLAPEDMEVVFRVAWYLESRLKCHALRRPNSSQLLRGLVLGSLFFEPSTRTRFSFETAMVRLGGSVLHSVGNTDAGEKAESFEDLGRVASSFADLIVMRHSSQDAVHRLAAHSESPVINAGNGPGEHPTQALLDLYTLRKHHESIQGLKVGVVGDLKGSRAAHSFLESLSHYQTQYALIAPPEFQAPAALQQSLKNRGCLVQEFEQWDAVLPELDVLYVTRLSEQTKSQSPSGPGLGQNKPSAVEAPGASLGRPLYCVTPEILKRAKPSLSLLHPLPRFGEIAPEVDQDPRARYFEQVANGLSVRMALLCLISGRADFST